MQVVNSKLQNLRNIREADDAPLELHLLLYHSREVANLSLGRVPVHLDRGKLPEWHMNVGSQRWWTMSVILRIVGLITGFFFF